MIISLLMSMITITIPPILLFIAYLLSSRSYKDREKATPFECGFDPKNKARIPFSTRFFLLAVIFLVFDIEIVLLMPTPMALYNNMFQDTIINIMMFLVILLLGLLHEWREGSLSWHQ